MEARAPDRGDVAGEALAAASAVASAHGLPTAAPEVLADGANLVVRFAPAPVVAKAAASTRLVRDAPAWSARELAVATVLTAAGVPVVAPSPEVPAVVHAHGGVAVTFWTFVPPADDAPPAPERLGAMLADLHAALRGCDLGLPVLAPLLEDIPRFLDRAARTGTLPAGDVAALRAAFERLTAEVSLDPGQPLHGDAHPGNLLAGPVWCDFEDTCRGPVAWDVAALARTPRLDGAAAVRATRARGDRRRPGRARAVARAARVASDGLGLPLRRARPGPATAGGGAARRLAPTGLIARADAPMGQRSEPAYYPCRIAERGVRAAAFGRIARPLTSGRRRR